jgi:hypothetical protein
LFHFFQEMLAFDLIAMGHGGSPCRFNPLIAGHAPASITAGQGLERGKKLNGRISPQWGGKKHFPETIHG